MALRPGRPHLDALAEQNKKRVSAVRPIDFEFIASFLRTRAGIVLSEDKTYLIESRLSPLVKARGMKDLSELVFAMKDLGDESVMDDVLDAMTTNETSFFRDPRVFDTFRDDVLPSLIALRKGANSIRIWCAAASTGQEPYSIAILLQEHPIAASGWKTSIVGTDISSTALKRAEDGTYSQFEVQRGMPTPLLIKYFEKNDKSWVVKPQVKSVVQYKEANLFDDFSTLGTFDAIFCRNVLIYFDVEARREILARISQRMRTGGILVVGGSESLNNISDDFARVPGKVGFYSVKRR